MVMPDMSALKVGGDDADKDMFSESKESVFQTPYHLAEHVAVGLDATYILYLDQSNIDKNLIGAALSSGAISFYDSSNLVKKETFKAHDETITGLKFSPKDDNLVYSSSLDMTIKLWDLRTDNNRKSVRKYVDTSTGERDWRKKPLTSFDVNCDNRFLVGGTEQVVGESFLLFWDIRSEDLLGGYWDSHQDDVTVTRFHPSNPDQLSSGSTDGIVNVYDISKPSEDEALSTSINTESSVQKLTYFGVGGEKLAILTHTEDLKLWKISDFGPYRSFERNDVTVGIKRSQTERTYVVDFHPFGDNNDDLMVLAGSNCPINPCLRLSLVKKKRLKPLADLSSPKVRNLIVRSSVYNRGFLYTGGEDGVLSMWKEGSEPETPANLKAKLPKKKKTPVTPY